MGTIPQVLKQKYYNICGTEFGIEHTEKKTLIWRALYGEKLACCDYYVFMRSYIKFLGLTLYKANSDTNIIHLQF